MVLSNGFETSFVKWFRYRWAVARQARKKISLMELLGITASDVAELKHSCAIHRESYDKWKRTFCCSFGRSRKYHCEF